MCDGDESAELCHKDTLEREQKSPAYLNFITLEFLKT
jgi:hypothetical protein